jgi:hypothetical protein
MKTLEYRTDDKSTWDRGEWDDEPDKMQWQDEETGYPCLIHRNTMGALCGYVGVSPGHPGYEKEYDYTDVAVHGCLTYAAFCEDVRCEERGVCHVVEEGEEEKVWWLGFDCNHYTDFAPGKTKFPGIGQIDGEVYKNIAYVKGEIRSLARQLKEVEVNGGPVSTSRDAAPGDG